MQTTRSGKVIMYPYSDKEVRNWCERYKANEGLYQYIDNSIKRLDEIKPAIYREDSIQPFISELKYYGWTNRLQFLFEKGKSTYTIVSPQNNESDYMKGYLDKFDKKLDKIKVITLKDAFMGTIQDILNSKEFTLAKGSITQDYFIITADNPTGNYYNKYIYIEVSLNSDSIKIDSSGSKGHSSYKGIKVKRTIFNKKDLVRRIELVAEKICLDFINYKHLKLEQQYKEYDKSKVKLDYVDYLNKKSHWLWNLWTK